MDFSFFDRVSIYGDVFYMTRHVFKYSATVLVLYNSAASKLLIKQTCDIAANANHRSIQLILLKTPIKIKNRLYSNPGGLLLFTLKGKLLRI